MERKLTYYPVLVTIEDYWLPQREIAIDIYNDGHFDKKKYPKLKGTKRLNQIILNYKSLGELKKLLQNVDGVVITTKNKTTNWEGCASFLKSNGRIKVFEGNGDGSDDKEMFYKEFLQNYEYQIKLESETY